MEGTVLCVCMCAHARVCAGVDVFASRPLLTSPHTPACTISRGSFAEFFELLQSDTDDVYMTVQTPVLFNPIIANLRKDIFVGPNSFTRFISDQKQYQYNMWCGRYGYLN